eukprot:1583651-Rhodomonas_salina.1
MAAMVGPHVAGHAGVTEANMMQYLGIIEQRTNEILQMYAAVQMQQQGVPLKDSLVNILGKGPELQQASYTHAVHCPVLSHTHGVQHPVLTEPTLLLGASKLAVSAPSLNQQSDSDDPSENE